jgi:hypothetical protein
MLAPPEPPDPPPLPPPVDVGAVGGKRPTIPLGGPNVVVGSPPHAPRAAPKDANTMIGTRMKGR